MADRLFRALIVLRVVVLLNAIGLNLFRYDNFTHPAAGMAVVAAMAVWTAVAIGVFARHRRRIPALFALDLAVALLALAASPLVKGAGFHATVPGFWITGALMAWAIHWRWQGGLVAAVLLSGTDLLIREEISQTVYGNVFLLMIAGPIVGYLCGSLQRMAAERAASERARAVADERARLARAVHDGVLQVLALVQRRGRELGADGAELARLAGEQESALRAMIRQQDETADPPTGVEAASTDPDTDLGAVLERLGGRRPPATDVVISGGPVRLPGPVADELAAVVGECLANVVKHVGEDAAAWLVLEDLGDRVVVTVRDDGPGIPEGRLEEAADQGRLGVAGSIRGRMRDLGGEADLFTGAGQGTEWELTLPREAR